MKRLLWKFTLVLLVPLALYAYIAERASWRPKTILQPKKMFGMGYSAIHLKFSESNRYLAVGRDDAASEQNADEILLYDVKAERIVRKLKAIRPIFIGTDYLIVESDDCAEVYSIPDGKLIARSSEDFGYYTMMPDGKTLVGSLFKGPGRWTPNIVWDFSAQTLRKDNSQLPQLPKDTHGQYELLADRQTLLIREEHTMFENGEVSGGGHAGMQFWDAKEKKSRLHLKEWTDVHSTGNVSSTANGLCAFWLSNKVELWNYKTGQLLNTLSIGSIEVMALSPDGTLLAGMKDDYREVIHLWDTKTGQAVRSLSTEQGMVSGLAFSPDGGTLASASHDGAIRLWRIK